MSTAPKLRLTEQQYLERERASELRHEYFRGEIFAMTGASRRHNLIAASVTRRIDEQFDGRRCEVYQSDMRVKVPASRLYTYPDVVATCDEPRFEDAEVDTLLNPRVIIEVLSKSTESWDRGRKFQHYRSIESLREFVLVAQDAMSVELFRRDGSDLWVLHALTDPSDVLELISIDCRLTLADIYARVDFSDDSGDSAS
jgi:Uma2 family endonuclease